MFKSLSAGSLFKKKAAKSPLMEQIQRNLTYEKLLQATQATQDSQETEAKTARKEDEDEDEDGDDDALDGE
jgi:hypothetical protein